ncbi:muts domain V-domain-containing protein [Dipodascopsis uninucleata]
MAPKTSQKTLNSFFQRKSPVDLDKQGQLVSSLTASPSPLSSQDAQSERRKSSETGSDSLKRFSNILTENYDRISGKISPAADDIRSLKRQKRDLPELDLHDRINNTSAPLQESFDNIKSNHSSSSALDESEHSSYEKVTDTGLDDDFTDIPFEDTNEEIVRDLRSRFSMKDTRRKSASVNSKNKARKLTPLEQQYVDIKRDNQSTVLAIEVGYKFHFYGNDAYIASKELNIYLSPGWKTIEEPFNPATQQEKFASSSVPVNRIYVHVKRLIEKGHKVGIVRQTETAALKAAGDNRSGPFARKLTELYTRGTYVESFTSEEGCNTSSSGEFLLSICEEQISDSNLTIGIVAVAPSTGQVVYEEFSDGFLRGELETRLLHIQPCEIIIVGEISKESRKVLANVSSSKSTSSSIRIENISKPDVDDAKSHLTNYYSNKLRSCREEEKSKQNNELLDAALNLSNSTAVCLSAMIKFLSDYGLERVFELSTCFENLKMRSYMILNGNALSSLEIYKNLTDNTEKGSLFWVMNHTRTKFGQRLMRKWIGHPLADRSVLEQRIQAIEVFKDGDDIRVEHLSNLLSKLPDLENGLIRVHYGRSSRSELLVILRAFMKISTTFLPTSINDKRLDSDIINNCIKILPTLKSDVALFLNEFDHDAAYRNEKYTFFKDESKYPRIQDEKMAIAAIENELELVLSSIRNLLNKSLLKYVTVAGIEYLIEVKNSETKSLPKNWIKVSGTKSVSRFHPPQVIKLVKELDQRRESLTIACNDAYKDFLVLISSKYEKFREVVQELAAVDCLMSLAQVSAQPNYSKPNFLDKPCVRVQEGRHPIVEHILLDNYVPNDIDISSNATRSIIITGPNMGGKSSYVRQTALIAIMAQIGCYVPAKSATLGILDAVYTRMGAYDNMMAGESTFMVELHECSDIIKVATPRSLVLLDEIGRGTGPIDGMSIAYSVLSYFITEIKALTLFITHYPLLCSFTERYPEVVRNVYMGYIEQQNDDGTEEIAFLYRAVEGIAHRSYGLNVARLAGLPNTIIDDATKVASEVEYAMKEREEINWALKARELLISDSVDIERLRSLLDYA